MLRLLSMIIVVSLAVLFVEVAAVLAVVLLAVAALSWLYSHARTRTEEDPYG
jgi:hypothetical protein